MLTLLIPRLFSPSSRATRALPLLRRPLSQAYSTGSTANQLRDLLHQNQQWASKISPVLLASLEKGQYPKCLWIGCSDSRVSPTTLTRQPLGSIFEHRNIANLVSPTDPSAMAIIEFAISLLRVPDLIVCGHTHCTGIATAMAHEEAKEDECKDHLHQWLTPARQVYRDHAKELQAMNSEERVLELGRLSVQASVSAIASTKAAQVAWSQGQTLRIHGWRFNLGEGLLEDLNMTRSGPSP
ncbi:MAG: carbonic anhydrase [Piptocephalis tieghemiana]|nr:MAG: carbonic anhydrase [Piptocephalis tieghemiana]